MSAAPPETKNGHARTDPLKERGLLLERAVLQPLINGARPDELAQFRQVGGAGNFQDPDLRAIAQAIGTVAARGAPVDLSTVWPEVVGGHHQVHINALQTLEASGGSHSGFNDNLAQLVKLRQLQATAKAFEAAHRALSGFGAHDKIPDVEQLLANHRTRLKAIGVEAKSCVPGLVPKSIATLAKEHPRLRDPLITGLLRRTETMNIIAPSKYGKTWLLHGMLMCMATGTAWMGMDCRPSKILLIDNELHEETLTHRLKTVAGKMGKNIDEIPDFHVLSVRGRQMDLSDLVSYCEENSLKPDVISIDAYYRIMNENMEENDNSDQTQMFNIIDRLAAMTGAAVINVHHSSKGSQADKALTDVGAGAGAIARAADAHLVLREHKEADSVTMEAACRSWPRLDKRVIKWSYPLWIMAEHLDPEALAGKKAVSQKPDRMTPKDFAEKYLRPDPRDYHAIVGHAAGDAIPERRVRMFLAGAVEAKVAFIHQRAVGRQVATYARIPPVHIEGEKADTVLRYHSENPDAETADIARACFVSTQYVRKVIKNNAKLDAKLPVSRNSVEFPYKSIGEMLLQQNETADAFPPTPPSGRNDLPTAVGTAVVGHPPTEQGIRGTADVAPVSSPVPPNTYPEKR